MARPTQGESEEIIETFYGINPVTFRIEGVSLNRDGILSRWGRDTDLKRHHIGDHDPKAEVRIIFGLIEVFSVQQAYVDDESTRKCIEELRKRAAEMKRQKIVAPK